MPIDGFLYLAGDFTECDNENLGPLVRYDVDRNVFQGLAPRNAVFRQNLAADPQFDLVYGEWGGPQILSWQYVEGELFIGGLFALTFENGDRWNNVAAVRLDTFEWRTFGQGLDGPVHALYVQDPETIFFGGSFNREGYEHEEPFATPGFVVYHGDHPIYSGFNPYTIAFTNNDFEEDWNIDGPVYAIWRGIIQTEPSGERLNPPTNQPEPARLTLVVAGGFTGGVLYQQDSFPWRRADGGVWGGPVRAMVAAPELNAFFFAGGFTTAGADGVPTGQHPSQGAVPVGHFVRWNYQNWVPRGGNSRPQKVWDSLRNGVSGGDVYDLSYSSSDGLIMLAGAFTAPQPYVVAYDLAKGSYDPLVVDENGRAVSLFQDPLYAVEIGEHQRTWTAWEGQWTDESWYGGVLSTCVDGNHFYASNNVVAFEGFVSHDGATVSGKWVRAGDSSEGARGIFALRLSTGNLLFEGWYQVNGQFGRTAWKEQRASAERPTLWTCNAVNTAEGASMGGVWRLGDGTVLNMCLSAGNAQGSTSAGRLYEGRSVLGGKTVHAQFYDDSGYGVSLFRQTSVDRAVENWFLGDLRDVDDSRCIEGVTCGRSVVWTREQGVAETGEACGANAGLNIWSGQWSLDAVNAVLYIQQGGDGLIHGAYGAGIIEGKVDPANSKHVTGHWVMPGFTQLVGQLRGSFNILMDDDGHSFKGTYQIDENVEGEIITDGDGNPRPIVFVWASRRLSTEVPDSTLTQARAFDAGNTVAGRWAVDNGPYDFVDICVTGDLMPKFEVVASAGSRWYEGDLVTITADSVDRTGRTLATSSWFDDSGSGVSFIRRVGRLTVEENWYAGSPLSFDAAECRATTCNLADRGTYSVTYKYVGPASRAECGVNSFRSPAKNPQQ